MASRHRALLLAGLATALCARTADALPPPPLSASFEAIADNGADPPNTAGAVGTTHLVVAAGSEIQMQSKAGAIVGASSLDAFFGMIAAPGPVREARVLFDPTWGRFIVVAATNFDTATSAVLLAVSQTDDPTGGWELYAVPVDAMGLDYAALPNAGFNKDWIVVSVDMLGVGTAAFHGTQTLVFDKVTAYFGAASGGGDHSTFTTSGMVPDDDYGLAPATMYDDTIGSLYLVDNYNGTSSTVRLIEIAGPVGAETFTRLPDVTPALGVWNDAPIVADFAPQLGGSNVATFDARIQNAVYRNGALWVAHTIYLPVPVPTRSAVQWLAIDPPSSTVLQEGRIQDPNDVHLYAIPTLAVNAFDDVLVGFSHFQASAWPSAHYAVRFGWQAAGVMSDSAEYQPGLWSYLKPDNAGRNAWGRLSATAVDPSDGTTLWTVQEYAAGDPDASLWGTRWGQLTVDCAGKPDMTPCESTDGKCSAGPKVCMNGTCTTGAAVECPAPEICHDTGACEPTTGLCVSPPLPDLTGCDDDDVCTSSDVCMAGTCTGEPKVCFAQDDCHEAGACDPATGTCTNPPLPDGTACVLGDRIDGVCGGGQDAASSSSSAGGAAPAPIGDTESDSGCSCRTRAASRRPPGLLGLLFLLVLARRRR